MNFMEELKRRRVVRTAFVYGAAAFVILTTSCGTTRATAR